MVAKPETNHFLTYVEIGFFSRILCSGTPSKLFKVFLHTMYETFSENSDSSILIHLQVVLVHVSVKAYPESKDTKTLEDIGK